MQILPQIINLQNNIHKINNRIIELKNEDYAIRANIEYLKDNYALSHLI
jgi:1,2-phenylacetyl-CoA epoxidase catalytic subunit